MANGQVTLTSAVKSLGNSLGKFLVKAEDHQMQYLPGYSEVAYLLEGEAKSIADPEFMRNFARLSLVKSSLPQGRTNPPE